MADIYDQHRAAFSNVSAYVITKDGERVATIAFKFPRDGAGRLYAYLHVIGVQMVRGFASGGGYDKRSAALAHAAQLLPDYNDADLTHRKPVRDDIERVLSRDDGNTWLNNLLSAHFEVFQAV